MAQGFDLGSVIAHIKADVSDFQKGITEVKKSMLGMSNEMVDFSKKITVGVGAAAVAMGYLGKQSIDAAAQQQSALIGLATVANAFKQNADDAKKAAVELSRDGLMPVKDAADGLKNLLATGFSLPEAINLMNAFKDSAAFNRQGTLAFGEAIVGATQGLKNQNSIMVDNAGITKNLSVILTDAGYSQQDLMKVTQDASVRQALYNGILKEASTFQGDAARSASTFQGNMSRLNTEVFNLKVSIGNELLPAATTFVKWISDEAIPKLRDFIQIIKDNKEAVIAIASTIVVLMIPAFISWTVAATSAAIATIAATWPLLVLAAAIGALVYVWVKNWDSIKANTLAVVDIISNYIKIFVLTVENKFAEIRNTVSAIIQNLRTTINNIWSGLVGDAKGAIQGVYDAFINKFSELWNKAKELAGKIRDAIRKAFDKDERNSPSIMDTLGETVRATNAALMQVKIPDIHQNILQSISGGSSYAPALAPVGGVSINVDLNGALISDEAGAQRISEIVGNNIIRKLQQNVRF